MQQHLQRAGLPNVFTRDGSVKSKEHLQPLALLQAAVGMLRASASNKKTNQHQLHALGIAAGEPNMT